MRILWINTFASVVGGCEVYVQRAVDELNKKGISSFLLYEKNPQESFLKIFQESYTDFDTAVQKCHPDLIFAHQIEDAFIEKCIESGIATIRFFHDYVPFCLKGIKMRPFTNEPCDQVASCSCYPLGCQLVRADNFFGMKLRTLSQLKRSQKLLRSLDGFCTSSDYVKKVAIDNGFPEEKIKRIYPIIPDVEERKIEKDHSLILYVGQLLRGKGVDVLIDAMTYLPKHKLVIIGEGRKKESYRKQVKKLKLEKRIQFLGFLPHEEIIEWYQRAACLVVPSRHPDPFVMVGAEAMRCKTAVIGSNLGGIPEWLEDGKTGFLVPHNSPQAIAEAVQKLDIKKMGEAGKKKIDSLQNQEEFIPFFHEILQQKKLTVFGSEKIEKKLQALLSEVKQAVQREFNPKLYRALILFGGYGRGEGGILVENGEEKAHNNLDFLLITKKFEKEAEKKFRDLLQPISKKYAIGFDLSVISEKKLKLSPTHLIWYDMYHGHRLLLGDAQFIHSLPFDKDDQILERDVLELMVNRGTLFVINQFLLKNQIAKKHKSVFIKHMMKAIIGFGDAFLFSLGEYHWSYQEKLRRILHHPKVPENLRAFYKEAAEFRFSPDYEKYAERDFQEWLDDTIAVTTPIYLEFERKRLKQPQMNWGNYLDILLQKSLTEKINTISGIARKCKGFLNLPKIKIGSTITSKIGFCAMTPSERLSVVFPYIALKTPENDVVKFLESKEYERAYLKEWSKYGDTNFFRSVKEWELNL